MPDNLEKAGDDADNNFSKEPVGSTTETCPLKEVKMIKAEWSPAEGMCGDDVALSGTSQNMPNDSAATGDVQKKGGSKITTLNTTGSNSYTFPWKIKDVVFKGTGLPEFYELIGKVTSNGKSAETEDGKHLKVKRVPDKDPESVTMSITAGVYGWTAAFKLGVKDKELLVTLTIEVKKAWLGKWIQFDATADGRTGWAFIKKVSSAWKFWDETSSPKAWKDLPRAVSSYTVNNIVFVKSGNDYVSRDNSSVKWPEAFADPSNYSSQMNAWLNNINSVWDGKFTLKRKGCDVTDCCSWKINFKAAWTDTGGDKTIYSIWAADWERSNAKDWYLSEGREGVAAHEAGHLIGAYDEYTGGAIDPSTSKIEANTIMGQNLTVGKARHLNNLRDKAKEKINGWISKSWDFEIE